MRAERVFEPRMRRDVADRTLPGYSAPSLTPGDFPLATRTLNRRAMREQHDQSERSQGDEAVPAEAAPAEPAVKKTRTRKTAGPKPAKVKAPPKPRVRKQRVKVPPRMFARWAICDNGLKRVAVFEYKDRAGADAKLAEMQERKPGAFFLQMVKDPYDPPVVPDQSATAPATAV